MKKQTNITNEDQFAALERKLKELAKVRDELSRQIRLFRESIRRLKKQREVNAELGEELVLDVVSLLELMARASSPKVTKEEQLVEEIARTPATKPKKIAVIRLLQSVLNILGEDNPPEDLAEALAAVFGDSWTEKSFTVLMGPKKTVTVHAYVRGVVPDEFKHYLALAFEKLRVVHLERVAEGAKVSAKLVALDKKIGSRWNSVEKLVVEKWLPNELAHLRKS